MLICSSTAMFRRHRYRSQCQSLYPASVVYIGLLAQLTSSCRHLLLQRGMRREKEVNIIDMRGHDTSVLLKVQSWDILDVASHKNTNNSWHIVAFMIISYTSQNQIMHLANETEMKYTLCRAKTTYAVSHWKIDLTDQLLQCGWSICSVLNSPSKVRRPSSLIRSKRFPWSLYSLLHRYFCRYYELIRLQLKQSVDGPQ